MITFTTQDSSELLTFAEVLKEAPLSYHHLEKVKIFRKEAAQLPLNTEAKKILIIGPCSIHSEEGALLYASKLAVWRKRLRDRFYVIMRCFFEKPRTLQGWPGFLLDPHLDHSYDVVTGIFQSRKILQEIIDMDLPVASEFLYPQLSHYLQDGITWGVIGARTSTSPIHRQLASSFSFPISFKNTLCGDLSLSTQAVQVAQSKNLFIETTPHGTFHAQETSGNPLAHLVLRGSLTKPNYDLASILQAEELMKAYGLLPRLLIDCAHGNSDKNPHLQKEIFLKLLSSNLPSSVRGIMFESYLEGGSQECSPSAHFATSVTDPCLSWEETEEVLESL